MKQKYIMVKAHDKAAFEEQLNAQFIAGYRVVSHAVAIDSNKGSNTMITYSAVMENLTEI